MPYRDLRAFVGAEAKQKHRHERRGRALLFLLGIRAFADMIVLMYH
jgi:hypothetical protein